MNGARLAMIAGEGVGFMALCHKLHVLLDFMLGALHNEWRTSGDDSR